MSNPLVTIEMEDGGVMKGELYPEIAPNTVNNFISLVQKGFYDGVGFHRIIPGMEEVSIGHALISDALWLGLEQTIAAYLGELK